MGTPKILVVDDAPSNREILGDLLHLRHCVVVEAADGYEALEVTQREQPALILMDLMRPGLDGWEAIRRIRA